MDTSVTHTRAGNSCAKALAWIVSTKASAHVAVRPHASGVAVKGVGWGRRHRTAQARERMGSPTQLQDPILLTPWVCSQQLVATHPRA
jgi:hypothetical protein